MVNIPRLRRMGLRGGIPVLLALAAGLALAQALPGFSIVAPADGATVQNPVVLEVALQNSVIGRPIDGLDHLHISIDGGPEVAIYRGGPISLPPLSRGSHRIEVELAGPSHRALLPRKHIDITVE